MLAIKFVSQSFITTDLYRLWGTYHDEATREPSSFQLSEFLKFGVGPGKNNVDILLTTDIYNLL